MPDATAGGLAAAALDWAYGKAISALPGMDGAAEMAARCLAEAGSREAAVDAVIRRQTAYAGAAGLATNLGGVLTLPISIPANLASALFIQLRMVAAIAHLRGYRVDDERVRMAAYLCLAGSGAGTALQEAGVALGARLSAKALGRVSGAAAARIQRSVGLRIASRAGSTGLASVARIVPLVGGLVGGGIDALVTRGIGMAAKRYFPMVESGAEPGDTEGLG